MLNLTFNARLAWLITTWCRFVALILQLGGQEKHGHAAHTQGACSPTCCGESPSALGQKVPLGDQKTLILDPSAKLLWSCGSGFLVLCNSKVMPWVFTRTPTERGSLSPCPPFAFDGCNRRFFWQKSWWYGTVGAAEIVKTCKNYSSRRTDSALSDVQTLNLTFNPRLAWLITTWCRFVALILQLGGQKKHGHAAHTQGACSPTCCGESPRALEQKVPLGDQKTLILDPSAKLLWSCGSGFWSFATAKLCHECLQEHQPNGAHSLHALLLHLMGAIGVLFWAERYGTVGEAEIAKTTLPDGQRAALSDLMPVMGECQRADVEFDFQRQTCMVNHYLMSVCCIDFAAWRAGEAWPRSAHTGSLLPYMLRGKSPCLGAESATGRPEDLDPGSFSEAFVELWFWVLVLCNSKVMPWVFTRTPTERGSLSPCPPFAFDGCDRRFFWQKSWWYGTVGAAEIVKTCKHYSSRRTDSSFVRRADVEFDFQPQTCMVNHYLMPVCCIDFAAWRAEEAWPRSAHTGSLLPYMLRGKSPCLGAESATGRPEDLDPGSFSEAFVELWFWVLVLCNSKVMPWVFTRTPTERGSLSPCPPFAFDGCNRFFFFCRNLEDMGQWEQQRS